MICRHCKKTKANRPRGLCWSCYYKPGVRELYPSTSKFARRGVANFNGAAPVPEAATEAVPGSEEKILVLMDRAAKKQALWHPDDVSVIQPAELILPMPVAVPHRQAG
jgi:hypothetical protein